VTFLVERLADLRRHLEHLRAIRPRVSSAVQLETDLSLHNDVLFSLLGVCQAVIDLADGRWPIADGPIADGRWPMADGRRSVAAGNGLHKSPVGVAEAASASSGRASNPPYLRGAAAGGTPAAPQLVRQWPMAVGG
jgi:hypothetical protein